MGCTDGGCQRGQPGLSCRRLDNEWPSTPLRPREDVMEKRKLVCEEEAGKSQEEGVWADMVSEGAGSRSLQPRGRLEGSDHSPPSTRLTPGSASCNLGHQTPVCTPAGVPTHMHKYAQAPAHSPWTREGAWTSLPSYPESFLLASCLFTLSRWVLTEDRHSLSWVRNCDLSSKPLGPSCLHNPSRGASSSAPCARHCALAVAKQEL